MNQNILSLILTNDKLFAPLVFTQKQLDVISKYLAKKQLSNAEKKALYTSITKKVKALETLESKSDKEYFIQGFNKILKERFNEAKKIIQEYSEEHKKIFVSGSFLFSENYNDVDIFIIRDKGYKEQWDSKKHLVFLTEKRLSQPIFQSALLISISNFQTPKIVHKKKPSLDNLMSTYHEAVIELLKKEEKPEAIRRLVFDYEMFCNNKILDPEELKNYIDRIKSLDFIFQELCKKLFAKTYLYIKIHEYIKTLINSIKVIKPNEHLLRFKDTYEELIYGRIRSTTTIN